MKQMMPASFVQVDERTESLSFQTAEKKLLSSENSLQDIIKDGPLRTVFMHIMNIVQKGLSSELRSIQSHSALVSLISRVERVDMSSSWFLAPMMGRTSKPPHIVYAMQI